MLIDKKTLEHLALLSRIKLDQKEEKKILQDLEKILAHFEELKEVNTEKVEPVSGGAQLQNVFRSDENAAMRLPGERAREAIPETKDGFLKIPPVFDA